MVARRLRVLAAGAGAVTVIWVMWRTASPVDCAAAGSLIARCGEATPGYADLRADLHALAELEEAHFTEHWTYGYLNQDLGFIPTEGVAVSISATQDGWAASATLASLGEDRGCAIYVGDGSRYKPHVMDGHDVRPGRIYCTD